MYFSIHIYRFYSVIEDKFGLYRIKEYIDETFVL